ncbi:hypothetical protein AYO38_06490 [bacterium SCGC AG-212-C10]|nr:hypothetical protein AYO38_06490 [bacterium SCGC AG-212-C10]
MLFVEPFYDGSHAAFLDGLRAHSQHEIVPLTLPGGEWRQRMRRGAAELHGLFPDDATHFDLVVATDMLDLPIWLALTRQRFAGTPVLYYLHENQLTYPRLKGTKFNSWFGAMNYNSALVADAVAFNSEYHRQDFFGALRTLGAQPNNWIATTGIEAIMARSDVLPVGVELNWLDALAPSQCTSSEPLILWNHRWEFDKAPDVFARAVTALAAEGLAFRLALAGDPGVNPHPAMQALREALAGHIVQFGRVESREAYGRLLWESDIVVSTTRHEFFGIGMVEALYAGCFPVAPARYNYPDLVPEHLHPQCLYEDESGLLDLLRTALRQRPVTYSLRQSAARFRWQQVAPQWDRAMESIAASYRRHSFQGNAL